MSQNMATFPKLHNLSYFGPLPSNRFSDTDTKLHFSSSLQGLGAVTSKARLCTSGHHSPTLHHNKNKSSRSTRNKKIHTF